LSSKHNNVIFFAHNPWDAHNFVYFDIVDEAMEFFNNRWGEFGGYNA